MKKFYPLLIGLLVFVTNSFQAQAQEPAVSTYSPTQNATGVSLDVVLELTFDVDIAYNSDTEHYNVEIFKEGGIFALATYQISQGQAQPALNISSKTLTITPSVNFEPESNYYIKIQAGAIVSASDATPFPGIDNSENNNWRFTTVSRPAVSTTSPIHNATGVTGLQRLSVTFNEEITLGANKNLIIKKSDGTVFQTINTTNDAGLISVSTTDNKTVEINHNAFNGGQGFYIDAEEGLVVSNASGVGSAAIDGTSSWAFTTGPKPAMQGMEPAGFPSGVTGDQLLVLTFAEEVTLQENKTITIHNWDGSEFQSINSSNTDLVAFDNTTNAISINHDRFSGDQSYYVTIEEGLVLANDNQTASAAITGNSTWSFTTAGTPSITFDSPGSDATDISANAPLIISFSEQVFKEEDKNLTIFNSNHTPFQTINTTTDSELITFNATNDVITINHNSFAGGSSYYVTLEEGVFVSETTAIGNSEITNTDNWTFSTANTPLIDSFSPDGETAVAGNRTLEITFDQNISPGNNKNLYIYKNTDDQLFQTINTTDDADLFSVTEATLQINHNPLPENTSFYVLTDEGLVVSASTAIDGEGINSSSTWTFTTTSGPIAETLTPANTSTGNSVSAPLSIDFNEPITLGSTGSITIHLSTDNSVVETINYDSPNLSVSNDILTINHQELLPGTDYFITIDDGLIISSTTGTTWAGITGSDWSFTTGSAPTVSELNPLNEEPSAPIDQPFTITFSESIKRGTTGALQIRKADGTLITTLAFEDADLQFNNKQLIIAHDDLLPETTYYIEITPGVVVSGTTDVTFDGFSGSSHWSFTTATVPSVESFSPVNGGTLSSAQQPISITFSEAIELGSSGSFRIRYNDGTPFQTIDVEDGELIDINNQTLTISHDEFAPNSDYYILIDEGFIEATGSGVKYPGIQDPATWAFSAPSGPGITSYTPADGAIDIPVNTLLELTFDETIARGNGNMVIHNQDGSDAITVAASSVNNLIIDGSTLQFPNLTLPHEETVYITMDEGFITSATSGFSFAGISDPAEWGFTTLPEPPAWSNGYPNFSLQTTSTINLDLQTTHDANYYFVITQGSTQPTTTEIMNGEKAGGGNGLSSGSGELFANAPLTRENINISTLSSGSNYYMHVVAKNPDKELYSGIATIVIDKTAPVTSIIPVNGTTHFPESGVIHISFDETIYNDQGNRVDETNISGLVNLVLESDDSPVDCSVSIDASGTEIRITPDVPMAPVTSYTVTMQPVYDHVGNGQSGNVSSTFSTDKLNIWTGDGNVSVWSDANNWSTGAFENNTSILVPSTATFAPVVNTDIEVYNLNIEPGEALSHSSGSLTVNGEFRLQSSTTANASYIQTGGSLTVANDSVKIEQHISGLEHVYFLSSPVSGATKSKIGLDGQALSFDNANNVWVELTTSEMEPGKGYVAKSSQSLTFSGAINTGSYEMGVNRTPRAKGWNLLGNPFTASVNWSNIDPTDKNNIVDAFWIYLDDQGGYGAYNENAGISINIEDPKIPSNHSFWVKVNEGEDYDTGSLTLRPEVLEVNTNSYLKSAEKSQFPGFKLAAVSSAGTDETGVLFISDAMPGSDLYDTEKMQASNPELLQIFTTNSNNKMLCINGLPESETNEVSLGYIAGKPGAYTIEMKENYLPEHLNLILKDHVTNEEHILSQNSYQFNVESKGTSVNRFTLKTARAIATHIKQDIDSERKTNSLVYSHQSQIVIETPNVQNLRYHLNDLSGRTLETGKLNAGSTHYIDTPNTGIYVVTILSDDGKEQHKVAVEN